MKTMTCKQLGGPETCNQEFRAETFDEMAEMSKQHGMKMMQEPSHQEAMQKMMELMQDANAMKNWFEEKKKAFDELPEEKYV